MLAVTIDQAGFYDDGSRWWTNTSGPTISGTFQGSTSLHLTIDGQNSNVTPTLNGTSWTVQLPSGAIANTGSYVQAVLENGLTAQVTTGHMIAYDDGSPAVSLAGSTVIDERGDSIDFSGEVPIHTHAGAKIDLSTGCPDVYLYSYLHDPVLTFGGETSPNPFAWHVAAQSAIGIDASKSAYRVRTDATTVVLDWTSPTAGSGGADTATLMRSGAQGVAELGTHEGTMYIDFRFDDFVGKETIATACWTNHPLAAPLQISPLVKSTSPSSLFPMSLPADSPISKVITGTEVSIAVQDIAQVTAEPVTLSIPVPAPSASFTRTTIDNLIESNYGASNVFCGLNPSISSDERCHTTIPRTSGTVSASGAVTSASYRWVVHDIATNTIVCAAADALVCTLNGRKAGEAPHHYTLELLVAPIAELWPSVEPSVSEYAYLGRTYTGVAPQYRYQCTQLTPASTCLSRSCDMYCTQLTTYMEIDALDQATVTFDAITEQLATTGASSVAPTAPAYLAATSQSTGAMTWNAGTDLLPGPSN